MSVLNEVGEDDNSSSSSSSKSKRDFRWLCVFFCANMLNWVCGAAVATVFGPAQPYLAERIGVDIDSVNWIWTFCERRIVSFACPTNICTTRATPTATPLVVISEEGEIWVALGCSKGFFF